MIADGKFYLFAGQVNRRKRLRSLFALFMDPGSVFFLQILIFTIRNFMFENHEFQTVTLFICLYHLHFSCLFSSSFG